MKSNSSKLAMKIRRKKNQTRRKRVKKVGSRKNHKRNSKGMKKQKRKSRKYLRKRVLKSLGGLPVEFELYDEIELYDEREPGCKYYKVRYHNVEHAKKTSEIAGVIANAAGYNEEAAKLAKLAKLAGAWHDVMHPGVTNQGVQALKDYINDVELPVDADLKNAVNTFIDWTSRFSKLFEEVDISEMSVLEEWHKKVFEVETKLADGATKESIGAAILLTDMSKWPPGMDQQTIEETHGRNNNLGVILHMADIGTYGYYGETNIPGAADILSAEEKTTHADDLDVYTKNKKKQLVKKCSLNCMIEFVYEAGMYKKLGIKLTEKNINPTVRSAYNHIFCNKGKSDLEFFRGGQVYFIGNILAPKYEAYAEVAAETQSLNTLMNKFVSNATANAKMFEDEITARDIKDFTAAINAVRVWNGLPKLEDD